MTPEVNARERDDALAIVSERELAKIDFIFFLDYVYLNEPPDRMEGIPGGKIPFEKWDYILEMANSFLVDRKITVLKARQLGFTWLVGAYAAWLFAFYPGTLVVCLSRDRPQAESLVAKIRFIYMNLPKEWGLPEFQTDAGRELSIRHNDEVFSRILAYASTKDAARGDNANLVIQDEAEYHEYINENFSAIEPVANKGGQIIMGSSANKLLAVSLFKDLYLKAPGNGWKKMFFGWRVRPGRDDAWFERTKNSIPDSDLDNLSPDQFMEQEYPATEQESLSPSKARAYFDPTWVEYLAQFVSEPLRDVSAKEEDYRDFRNIYIARSPKGRYSAGTDVSYGIGQDYSATVILDLDSMHTVADIMSNQVGAAEWGEESMDLLKFYRNPWWGIEQNAMGLSCIDTAVRGRYPRLYHTNTATRKHAKKSLLAEPGWQTNQSTRAKMWSQLAAQINAGAIFIHSKQGHAQVRGIIRRSDGEPDHRSGAHDDYVVALAIAWAIREKTSASAPVDIFGKEVPVVVNLRANWS